MTTANQFAERPRPPLGTSDEIDGLGLGHGRTETAGARGEWPGGEPWPSDVLQGFEHEARGLLNVIVLGSHCLRRATATDEERHRWEGEIRAAAERLVELRSACRGHGWIAAESRVRAERGPAFLPDDVSRYLVA